MKPPPVVAVGKPADVTPKPVKPMIKSLAFEVEIVADGVVLLPVAVARAAALVSNGDAVFTPLIPNASIVNLAEAEALSVTVITLEVCAEVVVAVHDSACTVVPLAIDALWVNVRPVAVTEPTV